jgi:cell division protein ZipA
MPELRWILLVAGLLLIAGLYVWGVRSRRRSAPPPPERMAARVEPPRPATRPVHPEPRIEPRRVEPRIETPAAEPEPSDDHDPLDDTDRLPVLEIDTDAESGSAFEAEREALPEVEPEPVEPPPPTTRAGTRREPRLESADEAPEARPAPASAEAPGQRKPAAQRIVVVRLVATPPGSFAGAALVHALRAEHLEFGRYDIFHRLEATGRPVFSVASLREPGTFDLSTVNELEFRGIALFCVIPGPWPGLRSFDAMIAAARALASRLGGVLQDEKGTALSVQRIGHLREEIVEFEHSHPRSTD